MLPLMEFGSFNIPANSNVNEMIFLERKPMAAVIKKSLKIPKG
jgi:hypothetical protein